MITLRRATVDDVESLSHLAERIFRDTFATDNNHSDLDLYCAENFGSEVQQQEIEDSNAVTILAEVERERVAFAQLHLYAPKECLPANAPCELRRLYVSKEWHGRGIANEIMVHSLSTAAHAGADYIWLGVWEHNPRAIAFYRKYGFDVVGEHIFHFGNDPQRDLIMMAEIKRQPTL